MKIMKRFTFLLVLIFLIVKAYPQTYHITFDGMGETLLVDSVKVENLNQNTSLTLKGIDELDLLVNLGISNLSNSSESKLQISPNPMTGNCNVEFEAAASGQTAIEIYDITGKRISQLKELLTKGMHNFSIKGLSSGIYTLNIISDKYSYTSKLISINASGSNVSIVHLVSSTAALNSNHAAGVMKSNKSSKNMAYTTGDLLKLTGYSWIYKTVIMLVPIQDQKVTFNFVLCRDYENNKYAVVQIGKQMWMAENLNTGTMINNVDLQTDNHILEKYCYNNDENLCNTYGALYQWDEMMQYDSTTVNQGICPIGWHIPTIPEWTVLADTLGGWGVAGGKLKESGTAHWLDPNTGATNESGFSALAGGYRNYADFNFYDLKFYGYWWTTTGAIYYYLYQYEVSLTIFMHKKGDAFSVRCIKDQL